MLLLCLCSCLCTCNALAQNTASPAIEAERAKQQKIYQARGELRLEGYVIDRSLAAYALGNRRPQ